MPVSLLFKKIHWKLPMARPPIREIFSHTDTNTNTDNNSNSTTLTLTLSLTPRYSVVLRCSWFQYMPPACELLQVNSARHNRLPQLYSNTTEKVRSKRTTSDNGC